MNMPMKAIIKKDLKNILSDKRMFSAILMVPLIMTVVLPAIFMVAVYFGSDDRICSRCSHCSHSTLPAMI